MITYYAGIMILCITCTKTLDAYYPQKNMVPCQLQWVKPKTEPANKDFTLQSQIECSMVPERCPRPTPGVSTMGPWYLDGTKSIFIE